MGHIPSHYVPASDIIRPQLVGVRPFVYTPTGLHNMQHSHQVNQHFNYPQQYPLRNQQTNHQVMQYQQQQTTNNYQPQTLLPHNQLFTEQLSNQQQSPVAEIQQQMLEHQQQHPNSSSVIQQHQQIKVQQETQQPEAHQFSFHHPPLNGNPPQLPSEMTLSHIQQHAPLKQHLITTNELHHTEHKDEELSQKQLEELTLKYQLHQLQQMRRPQHEKHRKKQQQQQHKEQQKQRQQQQEQQQKQQQEQQQLHEQERQDQQQQQQQQKTQQQKQQQPLQQLNEKTEILNMEPTFTELHDQDQAMQVQKQPKPNGNSSEDDQTSTDHKFAEKSFDCLENYQKHLQQLKSIALTSDKTAAKEFSSVISTTDEKHNRDTENQYVSSNNITEVMGCKTPSKKNEKTVHDQSNKKITERIDMSKESKQEIKSTICISNSAKAEDSKRVLSLKQGGINEIATQKKDTDINLTKKTDQLQHETMEQQKSLRIRKEQRKDLRKKISEKIRSLPPKEKLLLLQQQIKRQAEALERLGQGKTKLGLRNESKNNEHSKMPAKKGSSVSVKSSLQERKIKEKTSGEIKNDSLVRNEVQLLKKREDVKYSLVSKKAQESSEMTEKEEETTFRRSPSKFRLAERMNVHEDESEAKEKRGKLDPVESSLHTFTNKIPSKLPHITVNNADNLNSKASVVDGNRSKPRCPEDAVSITSVAKTNQEIGQISKSPKKTSKLIATSKEASSSLSSMNNQVNKKGDPVQTATKEDRKQTGGLVHTTTIMSPRPTIAEDEVSEKINNHRCKESNKGKEITGNLYFQSNESDDLKTQEQPQGKCQAINCQLLDKQNMNVIVQEEPKERSCAVAVQEKKKLPKLIGQEKQKLSPLVVDSKPINVLSNVKTPERNFKIEMAPNFVNQTGLIRPIPKLPLQSIPSHGVVPEFSPMSIPSQFAHLQPPVNNLQQFQTFTNNQFQPIVRAEAGMGRKVNFMFNPSILPPMPPGHILPQNDTYTTNTHYDPVMVPSPLLVGVPGMAGHTPHHIARPIPHIPTQPWQNMSLPPMMHPRMTHFPPAYPPVLPNIGVNRNAPEFYSKIPERLPKIQPDTAFHLPYNNMSNLQMKFAGRNLLDEGSFHIPTFKADANPIAQFQNDFSSNRPAFNSSGRDMQGHTAVNASIVNSEEFPAIHSTSGQVVHNSSYLPSKVNFTQERDEESSIKHEGSMHTAESLDLGDKIETKYHGPQCSPLKRQGNFKPSVKIPTFNRTVRELISVPFTSDGSRLLYLLRKRHQGHPIAQEWFFICNGLLTSHFRKLWDPPCQDEEFQEVRKKLRSYENLFFSLICRYIKLVI